jgi:hypothetical protein
MKQSEHVLYITLIDFLLQLLFLGLVVGVIYAVAQQAEEEKKGTTGEETADVQIRKVKQLTGISDFTKLTDVLTRLGPLNPSAQYVEVDKDLSKKVGEVGGNQKATAILDDYAKKNTGQGYPSCLPENGIVSVIHAFNDRIEIQNISPPMKELLGQISVSPNSIASLSLKDFVNTFNPVLGLKSSRERKCRYNVELFEHSFDTRPRDAVRKIFVTWKLHPPSS